MLLVRDILLVEMIDVDGLGVMGRAQKLDEIPLEVFAVVRDYTLRSFLADCLYPPDVAFALDMALEAILVSILLFTNLAIPSETL